MERAILFVVRPPRPLHLRLPVDRPVDLPVDRPEVSDVGSCASARLADVSERILAEADKVICRTDLSFDIYQ